MNINDKNIALERRKRKQRIARKRQVRRQILAVGVLAVFVVLVCFGVGRWITQRNAARIDQIDLDDPTRPQIDVQLLTLNEFSRPGGKLNKINGIVIHYTGNPGSSAQGNRDYFESLKDSRVTKASSHFVVGLDGEIIQCVPTEEISYASNNRNRDTIAIEVCHPDETGKFNDVTYESLIHLTAWLCNRCGLDSEDVIRHYDVTEKICPKYYVEHEDAWMKLKDDVEEKRILLHELN